MRCGDDPYRSGDLLVAGETGTALFELAYDRDNGFEYFCRPIRGVRHGYPALLIGIVREKPHCWYAIHDGTFAIIQPDHWERVRLVSGLYHGKAKR